MFGAHLQLWRSADWIRAASALFAATNICTTPCCWGAAWSPGVSCARSDSPSPRPTFFGGGRTSCHSHFAVSSSCWIASRKTMTLPATQSTTSTTTSSSTINSNGVMNSNNDDDDDDSAPSKSRRRSRIQPAQWITCSSSRELVCAIDTILRPNDTVAELGSQLRDVSNAIGRKLAAGNGCTVLVDVTRNIVTSQQQQQRRSSTSSSRSSTFAKQTRITRSVPPPGPLTTGCNNNNKTVAQFIEIESLDGWRQAFLDAANSNNKTYTVLVLDLNAIVGNDLEWTSLALVREFVTLFPTCRTVLIKSENLNQWANRLVHGDWWIAGRVEGPTGRRKPTNPASSSTGPEKDDPGTINDAATSNSATNNNDPTRIHSPKIIATVGVDQYRQTIARTVQAGDAVLEVGCHLGTTTRLLQQQAGAAATLDDDDDDDLRHSSGGYAIGVDCGAKIVRGAQERYPDICFAVGNAWKTAELLRIQQRFLSDPQHAPEDQRLLPVVNNKKNKRLGFDVVYVDVGGLSGRDGLLEALSLISALMNALEPRCLVIKSLCVTRLSSTLRPFWQIHGKKAATEK